MKFIDGEHQQNFFTLCNEFLGIEEDDKERLVVLYIMAGNSELEKKMKPYFFDETFSFEEMFREKEFSFGIKVLAELAVSLYNFGTCCDTSNFSQLSNRNIQLALNALEYRFLD